MKKSKLKYIYGPVPSWRLGSSLGIDPISQKLKQCVFDCVYCQVGRAMPCLPRRKVYVKTRDILKELKHLPKMRIDYITFSGNGEPTLAKNLGALIKGAKKIRKEPIAVITNSSLLDRKDVRKELMPADLVMAKLDGNSESLLKKINHPKRIITLRKIISGLKKFKYHYKGTLALQIMFVKENRAHVKDIAVMAKQIKADKIFINTPLRPSECKPLSKREMEKIKRQFLKKGLTVVSVFDEKRKKVYPINATDTIKRRGKIN